MDQAALVKQKTDIVAVIGEHVKLTKAGRHFKGLCPFHEERSPSFMVSSELQIYKCFGCEKAGDVYTFIQEYEGLDFYEALKVLADRAGVTLKHFEGGSPEKPKILEANSLAARFYHYLLTRHKLGEVGATYIEKKRGLLSETIKTFQIGFAPPDAQFLFNTLTKKKNIKADVLEQSGLVFKTRLGYMDRFRGRVIFPIINHRGETVALAGRILPEFDDGKSGKYINSPETPVYHKSASLYGLNITKKDIRNSGVAVVVEGELDLLSLWQAGIKNVVAIKGTALTEEHVQLLSRFCGELVLALDSDFAGNTAAIRGLSFAQNAGLSLKVVELRDYKDPDEFVQDNPAGFQEAVKNAIDAWEFVINIVTARYDISSGSGKAQASREITPILSTIKDNIVQSHYIQKLAQRLKVPFEAVANEVLKHTPKEEVMHSVTKEKEEEKPRRELLEERLLSLLVNYSPKRVLSEDFGNIVSNLLVLKILEAMEEYLKGHKTFDLIVFSDSLPAEIREGFTSLIMLPSAQETGKPDQEIDLVKHEITEIILKEELVEVGEEITQAEKKGEEGKLHSLQEKFQDITRELSKIRQ